MRPPRQAMILAAGRGERMRPLTDTTPKPLLECGGETLIGRHLRRLRAAGFTRVVINLAWLGDRIRAAVGDGSAWGLSVTYSDEGAHALETAGGIARALPWLGEAPFLVINGDVVTDHPLDRLTLDEGDLAHLVLVDNPAHRASGDFALHGGRVREDGGERLTFAGLGVYDPALFRGLAREPARLAPLLTAAMHEDRVSGEHFRGLWRDIGTPERLEEADRVLGAAS